MKNKSVKFLDLGYQPLANSFIDKKNTNKKEKKYRLIVSFNKQNFLVSINNSFSSKEMFDDKYPYRSSMSKSVSNSFKKLSTSIEKKLKPNKILEIGSNDGTFLNNFSKKKIIGIEPCKNVEKLTKKKGYTTYPLYWNDKTCKFLKKKHGQFDLIFSANTLSHIKNLGNVFKNIFNILSDDGTLIIEDPSLLECIRTNTYDQFYNEHIYVFSSLGLNEVLKKNNLEIYKIDQLNIHGGSNRYYIKKIKNKKKIQNSFFKHIKDEIKFGLKKAKTYHDFSQKVKKSQKSLKKIFTILKKKNKKIIGYGDTAKSTQVLNYCGITNNEIDYFVDTTPDKQNKLTPGTKIKILKYKGGINKDVDYVYLGAWNFKEEILKKESKYVQRGGRFIVHVPFPRIL